jgi:creatinine amidohydrolase
MTPPCTPWSSAIDPLSQPHGAAKALLASGAPVFVPVNPVEYHGPHLSLHNDARITRGLVGLLHAAWCPDAPLLVTADLEMGVDPVPGPGTQERPFAEVRDRVTTACTGLAELGAKRVVLATFHGAPLHAQALQVGVRTLSELGVPAFAPMVSLLRRQMGFTPDALEDVWAHVGDPEERAALRAGLACDFHGGFMETSLALALSPDGVAADLSGVPDCPDFGPDKTLMALARRAERSGRGPLAQELRMAAWGKGWFGLRDFPGYTSRPRLATAAAGWTFVDHVLPAILEEGEQVLWGNRPPAEPPMGWLHDLSLGGRIKL